MKAAGIKHAWGLEYNADIAAVAQMNGFNTIVANILDCDPNEFEQVNFLHASPPCPNFSNAKANGEETELDIALAQRVAEFITVLLPDFFTLENIYAYRTSQSWETIARALLVHGYSLNYWHVNTADYGVPQTRKRMIVIARRDGLRPMLPSTTHAERPEAGLFGTLRPWVGWHDNLPGRGKKSHLSKWQVNRIDGRCLPLIIDSQNKRSARTAENGGFSFSTGTQPCFTVTSSWHKACPRMLFEDGFVGLARPEHAALWQSFPKEYQMPKINRVAFEGLGNAVPPLFAQRLFESLL